MGRTEYGSDDEVPKDNTPLLTHLFCTKPSVWYSEDHVGQHAGYGTAVFNLLWYLIEYYPSKLELINKMSKCHFYWVLYKLNWLGLHGTCSLSAVRFYFGEKMINHMLIFLSETLPPNTNKVFILKQEFKYPPSNLFFMATLWPCISPKLPLWGH